MILLAAVLAMATQSVADIRDRPRVLIVASPAEGDPRRRRQLKTLNEIRAKLNQRDVTVLDVTADRVGGEATVLRRRWRLSPAAFTVLLIGKDGHEALRRAEPIDGATLTAAIGAMPMRRAGLR